MVIIDRGRLHIRVVQDGLAVLLLALRLNVIGLKLEQLRRLFG